MSLKDFSVIQSKHFWNNSTSVRTTVLKDSVNVAYYIKKDLMQCVRMSIAAHFPNAKWQKATSH